MKKISLALLVLAPLASPAEESPVRISASLAYQSRYVLHGYRLSKHLYSADVYLSLPAGDRITVWVGSWYGTLTDGTYNELDLYAGFDVQLSDRFSAGLAYSLFNYLEAPFPTSDQAHEISGHLTFTSGPLTLSLRDLYDSEGRGHLTRGTAAFDVPLSETAGLSLSAEYGYSLDYFAIGDGPNHALFRAAVPWQFSKTFSLTPFLAHSLALDVIDSFEKDQTYGGLSLSASF